MMKYIPILINAVVLIYGGVIDYKRREIPNGVHVALLISGIVGFSVIPSILGLVIPAVLLAISAKITKSEVPGGDFKLLCSLGFASGLSELAIVVFLAGISAMVIGYIKRLPIKRHIPLCSYIAPAYIALQTIVIIIEKTFCKGAYL